MTTPEIEPLVPREQLNLEPFTEDEREITVREIETSGVVVRI
jgi:hypothetical protein